MYKQFRHPDYPRYILSPVGDPYEAEGEMVMDCQVLDDETEMYNGYAVWSVKRIEFLQEA